MIAAGKNLLFIINPISGGKNKAELQEKLKSFCKENNVLCTFYETTGKEDKKGIQRLFLALKADAVIAVGGDGTVNLVGNILAETETPLGIIPAGSANGLSKDLGVPWKRTEDALENIKRFQIKSIDTLKVNNHNSFHLIDLGFNARICHKFAESILRGKISYALIALKEFLTFKPFPYKIETPKHTYNGIAFMVTITNSNKIGTNIEINPLGEINDGFFEINIIKPFPKIHSLKIIHQLLHSSIHKSPYYQSIRCKESVISDFRHECLHIDGEPVNMGNKIEVKIVRNGLKVIL
jgi:diacylglycerol kinase (ATP)